VAPLPEIAQGVTSLAVLFQAAVLTVGPAGFPSVTAALEAAGAGDTILVAPGVYREHLIIREPVTLVGEPGAILDGSGEGTVLTIEARATVRGFTIRSSGRDQSREDSGILASEAHGLVVEGNRFEDVLFGVYVKESQAPVIRNNVMVGKDLAAPLRGDGIRLWYSHGGSITGNRIERTRDVVIWFSDRTGVRDNEVIDGRYGLHYMYSHHNEFTGNTFVGNHVGAFIMYSTDIVFRGNVFAHARGTTGRGLGFKDADRVVAEANVLVKNTIGISIDNSPSTRGVTNRFRGNVIAFNDVGVVALPSVQNNVFEQNQFLHNVQPVAVTGGGTALANRWSGNRWSEYAGFDRDGDGVGDTPFVFERLSDDLLAKHEALRLFDGGLAMTVVDLLGRAFPLLNPEPLVADATPLLRAAAVPTVAPPPRPSPLAAVGFLVAAALAAATLPRLRRPFRSAR
jgi:nitrous oxidase accessory protein